MRTSKLWRKSPARVEQYLDVCQKFLRRAKCTLNQVSRRLLQGENIAHDEKVFSIFEPRVGYSRLTSGSLGTRRKFARHRQEQRSLPDKLR